MKKVPNQNIYYSNFNAENINKISTATAKAKIRSVIMGICGSGKTTFINRLCNTNYQTGIFQGSLTRDLAYEDVAFYSKNIFRIYDTPGTSSNRNALEHAKVLRASLSCIPLNLILVQVKFQGRCDQMFENFSKLLQIFKGYESMIVLLISHLDIVQPNQKEKTVGIFDKLQKEYEVICPIVFYSNKKSDPECLSKLLYSIGQQKSPQMIKIDDEHFYKYFNVAKPKNTPKINVYIKQIQDLSNNFIKTFKQLNKDIPDIDDLVSQLKMYMKFSLKKMQDDQYKKYSVGFDNEHTTADLYLMISQMICSKTEEADFTADKLLTKKIQDEYHHEKVDIRDMFKQCPNPKCGLIWMRVQGCNGQTHCGKRPENYFDYFKNQFSYKYSFNFDSKKGIFTINKNKRQKINENAMKLGTNLAQKQRLNQRTFFDKQASMFMLSESKSKIQRADSQYGCKAEMVWKNLPRLPNIDELLKQYYGTSNFEQMASSQKFLQKQHKKFEQEVEGNAKKALDFMKSSE